jgi:hypothetical protein
VKSAAVQRTFGSQGARAKCDSNTAARIASFEKNPASSGTPAIAKVATRKVQYVIGIFRERPPIRRRSCSPPSAWMTEPEPRNRQALKKAWVTTWNIPATNAPTPHARNMYPSCDTVEYARTFLMSFCTRPIVAAKSAVNPPMTATTSSASGESRKSTLQRATM